MTRGSASKRALAIEAWAPLARFFVETIRHRQRILGRHGLTPGDARALLALDAEEGRTMRTLAQEWTCDASNATWIVDRLEERGLAERRGMPGDRRVKLVVLTPLGRETKARMLEDFYEPPPELVEMSRADLEALRDAVAKLPVRGASAEEASRAAGARSGTRRAGPRTPGGAVGEERRRPGERSA